MSDKLESKLDKEDLKNTIITIDSKAEWLILQIMLFDIELIWNGGQTEPVEKDHNAIGIYINSYTKLLYSYPDDLKAKKYKVISFKIFNDLYYK